MDVVDHIIIGGGMSFTFVKALGGSIGNSIHEDEMINTALDILQSAKTKMSKFIFLLMLSAQQNLAMMVNKIYLILTKYQRILKEWMQVQNL